MRNYNSQNDPIEKSSLVDYPNLGVSKHLEEQAANNATTFQSTYQKNYN